MRTKLHQIQIVHAYLIKIEQKEEDIYLAHAHCTDVDADDQSDFKGYEEFKLINGLLFKKRIPEG